MKKTLLVTLIGCFLAFNAFSNIKTAVANLSNGWSTPENWSPVGVPSWADTIIIPSNLTITVKGSCYSTPPLLSIFIYGTLNFDPSGKLDLANGTTINLTSGAKITSNGTTSEKITIGGVLKFSGKDDGTVTGPSFASLATGASPSGFATGIVLPLKLISFDYLLKDKNVTLQWCLVLESAEDAFSIEKMNKDGNWQVINTKKVSGKTGEKINGSFLVLEEVTGKNFYRLRMKNSYGNDSYSKILEVKINKAPEDLTLFPIPARGVVTVQFGNIIKEGSIYITNITGNLYIQQEINNQSSATINVADFPKGIYTVTCKSNNVQQSKRFIVNQ